MKIYWEKQNLIVLILKITEEPYNLSLDVWKAFPGSEAGVSSTLISLALFLQEHKEVCDLSSQKLSRNKSKSQQHFNSIIHKAWTLILNLQNINLQNLNLQNINHLRLPNTSFYREDEEVRIPPL